MCCRPSEPNPFLEEGVDEEGEEPGDLADLFREAGRGHDEEPLPSLEEEGEGEA